MKRLFVLFICVFLASCQTTQNAATQNTMPEDQSDVRFDVLAYRCHDDLIYLTRRHSGRYLLKVGAVMYEVEPLIHTEDSIKYTGLSGRLGFLVKEGGAFLEMRDEPARLCRPVMPKQMKQKLKPPQPEITEKTSLENTSKNNLPES